LLLSALFNINNKKCEILLQRATVHVINYGMSVSPYVESILEAPPGRAATRGQNTTVISQLPGAEILALLRLQKVLAPSCFDSPPPPRRPTPCQVGPRLRVGPTVTERRLAASISAGSLCRSSASHLRCRSYVISPLSSVSTSDSCVYTAAERPAAVVLRQRLQTACRAHGGAAA
jgi:hypothetical protein